MSAKDGTVLSDNPGQWDIERLASMDWEYIRLCLAKAAVIAMDAPSKLEIDGCKAFASLIEKMISTDNQRRDREDLVEMRDIVKQMESLKEWFDGAGGTVMGTPPSPPKVPPAH